MIIRAESIKENETIEAIIDELSAHGIIAEAQRYEDSIGGTRWSIDDIDEDLLEEQDLDWDDEEKLQYLEYCATMLCCNAVASGHETLTDMLTDYIERKA